MSLPESEEKSGLGDLQHRLEQGTLANVRLKRSRLNQTETSGGEETWSGDLIEDFGEDSNSASWRLIKKFLIGATAFFLVAIVVAVIVILNGSNLISNSNIVVDVRGPVSLKAGEAINLQTSIINRNKTALESARLLVEYPAGTRSAVDATLDLRREVFDLKNIPTGETINKTLQVLVFGGQGSQQKIKLTLEYRLAESNNVFSKKVEYDFTISDSPVTMTANLPDEINAGREFSFDIDLVSNSPTILNDLILDISFPPGFQLKDSSLAPTLDGHIWSLGDITAGVEKKLTVTGVLTGQENENKSFRIVVGPSVDGDNSQSFSYGDIFKTLVIKNPFIGTELSLNGQAGSEVILKPKDLVKGKIDWINNLPDNISDLEMEMSLVGSAIDRRSIKVENGFYRSQDDKIIWNKSLVESLAMIRPGETGSVSFDFSMLPLSALRGNLSRNPQVDLSLIVSGRSISEENQSDQVRTELKKTIKILSVPQIASQLSYTTGPFTNSGPASPRVEAKTTYTVTWLAINPANEVRNVKIVATLPVYIDWQNAIYPQNEKISFDPSSRQVSWEVGVLPAGLGFDSPPREASFQIAFTPSLSQVESQPDLVSLVRLFGFDSFANKDVSANADSLNTGSLEEFRSLVGAGLVKE